MSKLSANVAEAASHINQELTTVNDSTQKTIHEVFTTAV